MLFEALHLYLWQRCELLARRYVGEKDYRRALIFNPGGARRVGGNHDAGQSPPVVSHLGKKGSSKVRRRLATGWMLRRIQISRHDCRRAIGLSFRSAKNWHTNYQLLTIKQENKRDQNVLQEVVCCGGGYHIVDRNHSGSVRTNQRHWL
jgi:hypothetical protein